MAGFKREKKKGFSSVRSAELYQHSGSFQYKYPAAKLSSSLGLLIFFFSIDQKWKFFSEIEIKIP